MESSNEERAIKEEISSKPTFVDSRQMPHFAKMPRFKLPGRLVRATICPTLSILMMAATIATATTTTYRSGRDSSVVGNKTTNGAKEAAFWMKRKQVQKESDMNLCSKEASSLSRREGQCLWGTDMPNLYGSPGRICRPWDVLYLRLEAQHGAATCCAHLECMH